MITQTCKLTQNKTKKENKFGSFVLSSSGKYVPIPSIFLVYNTSVDNIIFSLALLILQTQVLLYMDYSKKLFVLLLSCMALIVNYNNVNSVSAAASVVGLNYGTLGNNLPSRPMLSSSTNLKTL